MEIHRLWCKLYEKYQDKDQIYLPAEFFGRVAALSNAMVLMAFQGGRLIGFDLLLLRGNTMESTYSGIDAEHVGSTPVHRHMGHEIIRLAIARGARSVDFGVSNEEAKARMGCELRIAHAYVLPLSPLFRWLRLDRLVMPESQRAKSEGRQPEETGNAM